MKRAVYRKDYRGKCGRIDSDKNFGVSLSYMIGIIMFPFYYALYLLFNNFIHFAFTDTVHHEKILANTSIK